MMILAEVLGYAIAMFVVALVFAAAGNEGVVAFEDLGEGMLFTAVLGFFAGVGMQGKPGTANGGPMFAAAALVAFIGATFVERPGSFDMSPSKVSAKE